MYLKLFKSKRRKHHVYNVVLFIRSKRLFIKCGSFFYFPKISRFVLSIDFFLLKYYVNILDLKDIDYNLVIFKKGLGSNYFFFDINNFLVM